jgi:hypothetical protein
MMSNAAIILGAGASRGASYIGPKDFQSALDRDFFKLLNQLTVADKGSINAHTVLNWVRELGPQYSRSLEQAFYTLQSRAYLLEKFEGKGKVPPTDDDVIEKFATCIQAVLRKAHGINVCAHHEKLFEELGSGDTVITFNYDLVAERALRSRAEPLHVSFEALYGLDTLGSSTIDFPLLLKLHGSSNWKINKAKKKILVNMSQWSKLNSPSYRGDVGEGTWFPIFLPFWEKRIEHEPWIQFWKLAYKRLKLVDKVVVWGYSLPQTDIKARLLFKLGLENRPMQLCVIDLNKGTRQRWRKLFPAAQFSGFETVQEYFSSMA